MSIRLDEKVAVITGASAGIGRAIALDLAGRGVKIVGTGRRPEPAADTQKEVEAIGGTFTYVQADVGQWEDCRHTVDVALDTYGRIDILINNAGTVLPMGRIDEIEEDGWRTVSGTVLDGSLFMSRLALPTMRAQDDGVILFMASGAGVQGLSRHGSYATSKAGVIHLSKVIAVENAGTGVRSNALVIGIVTTELSYAVLMDHGLEIRSQTPATAAASGLDPAALGKFIIQPEGVARAVAMLCSEEAREINGSTIAIDRCFSAGAFNSLVVELGATGMAG